MKLSWRWLCDHVDLTDQAPEEIARLLTLRTALIESVDDRRLGLQGVVVGEVIECGKHPGADRLSLCRVAWGQGEPARVVCGAPNVRAGQKVLFATVGVMLPNGVKLRAAKIRGEPSEGMICAEDELGLGPEHDGIVVLDARAEVGRPASELAEVGDVILDIDNKSITHRPDLWGHRGFARELAAILGRELRPLPVVDELVAADLGPAIELEAGSGCPLYAGLCLEQSPRRSPDWLRFRLVACGMRPLDLVVDLSNYVMLELGQPTHPFDRDRLAGDRIQVRRGRPEERLACLDGVERLVGSEDCLICDSAGPVALAGIIGGASCEVGPATRRVFLESASFEPARLRRTASRLGVRTEALARFEKALDPELVEQALRRYVWLLRDLCPTAVVAPGYRRAGRAVAPAVEIDLDVDLVSTRLGMTVAEPEVRAVLGALGFGVVAAGAGRLRVHVPSWRATRDISRVEDLVEEIGRLLGYDRIPAIEPRARLRSGRRERILDVEGSVRHVLSRERAFTEIASYSTVPERWLAQVGWVASGELPRISNPLQQDAARLRPTVAIGLLARLEDWLRAGPEGRVYEIGRGYHVAGGQAVEVTEVVALLAHRAVADPRDLFRAMKGIAQGVIASACGGTAEWPASAPHPALPWLHPRRCARITLGEVELGYAGAVHPRTLVDLGVDGSAALLRLDLGALALLPPRPHQYQPPSKMPSALIDLAFIAPYAVSSASIEAALREAGPRTLRLVEAFDVYRGAPLGPGERSIAYRLAFTADDRTLTDDEVMASRARLVEAVERLGVRLR